MSKNTSRKPGEVIAILMVDESGESDQILKSQVGHKV